MFCCCRLTFVGDIECYWIDWKFVINCCIGTWKIRNILNNMPDADDNIMMKTNWILIMIVLLESKLKFNWITIIRLFSNVTRIRPHTAHTAAQHKHYCVYNSINLCARTIYIWLYFECCNDFKIFDGEKMIIAFSIQVFLCCQNFNMILWCHATSINYVLEAFETDIEFWSNLSGILIISSQQV